MSHRTEKPDGAIHDERIENVLSRVFRRNGYEAVEFRSPLIELLEQERDPDEDTAEEAEEEKREISRTVRQQTLGHMLEYLFADGPHPGSSMRRLYALARAFRPKLIAEMNGTDLAQMFDEGRAAQSWRVNQMFDGYLKKRGAHSGKLPFQKSDEARRKYSAAQRGNTNRKGKTGRRKTAQSKPKK